MATIHELTPRDPRIVDADEATLDAILARERDALVVVYLWGRDCPNCVVFARRLPDLMKQLTGAPLVLVKVDVYTHTDVARRYGVHGIPHFLLFRGGKRLGKMSEFRGDEFWLEVVRERLPGTSPIPSLTPQGGGSEEG